MPPNSPYRFEICVESPDAFAAAANLADRIELCSGLDVGGLTPDHGLMAYAAANGVPTHVLIRGRVGDFTMTADDIFVACQNIEAARRLGLAGIVIGAEREGKLDLNALEIMCKAAGDMDMTLHRVIDVLADPVAALEDAVSLGFKRILTSGGATSAPQGIRGLKQLHVASNGRIEIMAGGGLRSAALAKLLRATPLTSFHASCRRKTALDRRYTDFGFGETQSAFDHEEAARMVQLLNQQDTRDERHG